MHLFICLLLVLTSLFSHEGTADKPISFVSIPFSDKSNMFQNFFPMVNYLQNKTGLNIIMHYEPEYEKVLESFAQGEIDIAFLGPLPIAYLYKQYPHIEPMVTFNEADGTSSYKCALVKFIPDHIDFTTPANIKVGLTQPLSTCGFLMTYLLIKEYAKADLEEMKYQYLGTHDEAALSVVRGTHDIGGIKKDFALAYRSLGVEIIAESEDLPGFSLVANTKTQSLNKIEKIKKALLEATKDIYSNWGANISHGVVEGSLDTYRYLNFHGADMQIKTKGNY